MKKIIISIVAVAALVVLPMNVIGQISVSDNAVKLGATIISPISLTTGADELNFGEITNVWADSVVVDPANNRSSSRTENLFGEGNKVPTLTVTGEEGHDFKIVLPTSPVTLSGAGTSMTAKAFTHDYGALMQTLAAGKAFHIGATLMIAASQAIGVYSGTFPVTVSYE